MKRAMLIVGEGSKSRDAALEIGRVADAVRGRIDYDAVLGGDMGEGLPSLREGIASALTDGATQVVLVPYVLGLDAQVKQELLRVIEEMGRRFPDAEIVMAESVGADERMADIVCDRARAAEMRMRSAGGRAVLTVDGLVRRPLSLTYADLLKAPGQVEDVSALVPGRQGAGVMVSSLLREAGPDASARRITFHSADGGFEASIPIQEARERGILIYRLQDGPLSERTGGPVRLIVPGAEDACNNVKRVVRMEIKV